MNYGPILITGVTGFLGAVLARIASFRCRTYGICHQTQGAPDHGQYSAVSVDIRDKERVRQVVSQIAPVAIIHCAALTDVDFCATNSATASDVNVRGTENVALAAAQLGAKFVYVSTDLVFRGDKGCYTEEDIPNPICVYGRTKYEGERIVGSICGNYCIGRAALVFGLGCSRRTCFAERLIWNLQMGRNVKLFRDEFRSPIYLPSLCEALLELATGHLTGIYHLCGHERVSRLEFGLRLAEIFRFRQDLIEAMSRENHPFIDPRPSDCSMRYMKARRDLRTIFQPLTESLRMMHTLYSRSNRGNELAEILNSNRDRIHKGT